MRHFIRKANSTSKLLTIILLLVNLFLIESCKHDEIIGQIDENEVNQSKLINFKGLPVNHRFKTPVEELETEHNYEVLKSIYNTQKRVLQNGLKSSTSNTITYDLPSVEKIVFEAEKHVENYPFGNNKTEEEKWEMIKSDFPTLTEQEITEKINLIDEYYSQNLEYETIIGLADNNSTEASDHVTRSESQISRVLCIITKFQDPNHIIAPVISGGWIRTGEFSYVRSLVSIYFASTKAQSFSETEFPQLSGTDTKRDAFRHVLWSSLLAKYYWTISNKDVRLRFSEAVGNANEACGENEIDGMNMDFHNNGVGRSIFDLNTTFIGNETITIGLNIPSNDSLLVLGRDKINDARFIDPSIYTTRTDRVNQITTTNPEQAVYLK